jgi:hypothetical protein
MGALVVSFVVISGLRPGESGASFATKEFRRRESL